MHRYVAMCEFCNVAALPQIGDFVITITDQLRPDLTPANATVAVTEINVRGGVTTTLGP
jgi:hypothetical protein